MFVGLFVERCRQRPGGFGAGALTHAWRNQFAASRSWMRPTCQGGGRLICWSPLPFKSLQQHAPSFSSSEAHQSPSLGGYHTLLQLTNSVRVRVLHQAEARKIYYRKDHKMKDECRALHDKYKLERSDSRRSVTILRKKLSSAPLSIRDVFEPDGPAQEEIIF